MNTTSSLLSIRSVNLYTIKGGSRRAEKSRKVLMMMNAAKLEWVGPKAGLEQTKSRPGAGWEQARSRPGATQEQGRSKSRAGVLAVHIPNFIQIVLKHGTEKNFLLVGFDLLVQSVKKIDIVISNSFNVFF